MLPCFGGNDCRNLSASTENEHSCKNIMKFYGIFLLIKRCLNVLSLHWKDRKQTFSRKSNFHKRDYVRIIFERRYSKLPW